MKRQILLLIIMIPFMTNAQDKVYSELCIMNPETREVTVVYDADYHLEAPNWTPDGQFLVFNSGGRLYKIPVNEGNPVDEDILVDGGNPVNEGNPVDERQPILIETGYADRCNNDHVLSPDGSRIALSHIESESRVSKIYVVPFSGGTPELITHKGPSYLHGWSPVADELAYCAERNGDYDVYVIDMKTQKEKQLTDTPGLDDGPEYSPDGKYIYFNSTRTGTMQIWRMKTDGSEQTQITFDKYNDWFPHPSPDNKWLVFISYDPSVSAGSHPPNKDVMLRRIPVGGGEPETLLELFGGQGTINVPSWSPDSRQFAFVRYTLVE